jgi:hypothetical protein
VPVSHPPRTFRFVRATRTVEVEVDVADLQPGQLRRTGTVAQFHQPHSTFARFRQVYDAELPGLTDREGEGRACHHPVRTWSSTAGPGCVAARVLLISTRLPSGSRM